MQPKRHAAERLAKISWSRPPSSLEAELTSKDRAVHLGISLDPVYYVGGMLADDQDISAVERVLMEVDSR